MTAERDEAQGESGSEFLLQTRVPIALGRWLRLYAARRHKRMATIARDALESYRRGVKRGEIATPPPVDTQEKPAYEPRRGGPTPLELADGERRLRLAVRLPTELANWLREHAVLEGTSQAQIVSEALTIYRQKHDST